ncbi:tetratricopeptide repeat domain 19 [Megalopta genalis]|uniref:tetratricopeptide repeat domain 19 n=1 Tax=Megalopta genalis TaxID=115081 RepID=UPI0014431980|nr:tetratricopeptide repeat protein 19 homolog, mitochondrial [Megalopta genalis]
MYCRKIIANALKHTQLYTRSTLIVTNMYQLNRWKNALIVYLPQISDIRRLYNPKFHERRKSNLSQTMFISISSSFLFTLFGSEDKEKDDEAELIMTIKRSILAIQKGEYKKAEQMLHIALRQAQTLQHYNGITYVYDVMANLAMNVSDYKKAEKLFVSVLQRLLSKGVAQDDLAVIHISLKIADMYGKMGETEKAENGFLFCLQHLKNHMAKDPKNPNILQLLGLASEWYGSFLYAQSKYVDALVYLSEAYNIAVKILDKEDEQIVVLLNNLGIVNCMIKEYEQAIKYLTEAIEIGKKLPEMLDIGSIYVNLGNVYLEKGLYEEAKKSCKEGKRLAKEQNHKNSVDVAEECLERIKNMMV